MASMESGKIVVRSGYGIYYNGGAYNCFMRNLSAQPPFAIPIRVISSSAAILTLNSGFLVTPPGKTITEYLGDRSLLPHAVCADLEFLNSTGSAEPHAAASGLSGDEGNELDTQ